MIKDYKDHLYRVYVTDSLKARTGFTERYADWIDPKPAKRERTREETISSVTNKLNSMWEEDSSDPI